MEIEQYTAAHRLRDLIGDNSLLLMVISRFGVPLRLANLSVAEIAERTGLHAETFLCVANMISGKSYDDAGVDLGALMDYLKRAHAFFLDFFLPAIRRKLIDAVDYTRSHDTALLILRFFDEYVGEVRSHMEYENRTLFGYIDELLAGRAADSGYSIAAFAEHHDAIAEKLSRLKDVLVRYCPEGDADLLNSALFDIINCEADLISHCQVEDKILVPAVARAEQVASRADVVAHSADGKLHAKADEEEGDSGLGKREREIIACVARGMSNKEIADRLCISVHTVTTHRRNICAKLEIHSPAGLTIYAILHGIIDPKDIDI